MVVWNGVGERHRASHQVRDPFLPSENLEPGHHARVCNPTPGARCQHQAVISREHTRSRRLPAATNKGGSLTPWPRPAAPGSSPAPGGCYDCHAADAKGDPAIGAPNLTAPDALYGGDAESLTMSISYGRHGMCPAWAGRITAAGIRETAIYVYSLSHPGSGTARRRRLLVSSNRRSFVLMGCGALVGLLMAGYSLFTARGTSTLIVPPEDVALVNQQPIARSDYLLQLQTLYGVDLAHATDAQRHKVLDDMIREELFVQRGKELDVAAADPECAPPWSTRSSWKSRPTPSPRNRARRSCEAYYASHQARYASEGVMTLRDYVFAQGDAKAAAEAAEAFRTSAPTPALLARWHASDSRKVAGEEFYFAARIHLGDALFDVARDLPDGGVSAPLSLPDGIHVLYMLENKRPDALRLRRRPRSGTDRLPQRCHRPPAHGRRGIFAQARERADRRRHSLMPRHSALCAGRDHDAVSPAPAPIPAANPIRSGRSRAPMSIWS